MTMNIKFYNALILFSSVLFSTQLLATSPQADDSNLTAPIQQKIIAYFDTKGHLSKTAFNQGYYRVLLGRNLNGDYLVQDFYQDKQTPQTSPFWITRLDAVLSFDHHIHEGTATFSRKDGSKLGESTVSNGKEISGRGFYLNGQRATEYKLNIRNEFDTTLWYASGQKAAEYVADSSHKIIKGIAWDINGNKIDNLQLLKNQIYSKWKFE